jgi:protein-tyrosine-phosphatase
VTRTLLFVCPHGAAKSRLAAAYFNAAAPSGWHATTLPPMSISLPEP